MGSVYRKLKQGRSLGWYIAYVDVDGRRRHLATHQATKKAAQILLAEIEGRVRRSQVGVPERGEPKSLTVSALTQRFLSRPCGPQIKNPDAYRRTVRANMARVLPKIGNMSSSRLTAQHLSHLRDELSARLAPNTVRTTFAVFSAVLGWAVREGMLAQNPLRSLSLPRRESALEFLSAEEAGRLLSVARTRAERGSLRDGVRHVALGLALLTGLRRGEIFGLRFCDLDLGQERLTIARSYRSTPKSGEARHLRLPPDLVPVLRAWQARCPHTPDGIVCPVLHRGVWGLSGTRIDHGLSELLRAAGCKPLRRSWHALRHTFASLFVMAGGSVYTLAKILGHGDIATTQIYAHLGAEFLSAEMSRVRLKP